MSYVSEFTSFVRLYPHPPTVEDGLSFWLGHRYHREILVRWPFCRYPQLIERSETFFRKHGGKSVFLARFTPGLRAFAPLVAGMLKMPVSRFYAANILSAFIWALLHVLPGVLLGGRVHSADDAPGRLAILVLVLGGVIWFTIRGVWIGFQRGLPVLQSHLDRLRYWAAMQANLNPPLTTELINEMRAADLPL